MSFLKTTFHILTNKREIKEPIIHKDFIENPPLIDNLTTLANTNNPNIDIKKVEEHLKLFSIGHTGEKSVLFELQHSMLPIVVLHDINIEMDDYQAQLDFVIITHKFILVLEVKKLIGDVQVTDKGEFIRIIKRNNRVVKKEGMYSPINQVERHVAVLEKLLKTKGIIKKCPIRYAVTFANPKTILDISKKAPVHIQSSIIRHDQIKPFLKAELAKESPVFMLDELLYKIADGLMQNNKEKSFEIERYLLDKASTEQENVLALPNVAATNENSDDLKSKLTAFRLQRSRELAIKPFYIFTNKTLDAIIEKKPRTIKELLEVEGIGPKKAEDYGEDILTIIRTRQLN